MLRRKRVEGLVPRRVGIVDSEREKGRGVFSRDTHQNFTLSLLICQ